MDGDGHPRKGTILVVWGALTASVGVYALLALLVSRSARVPAGTAQWAPALAGTLSFALPPVALVAGLVGYRLLIGRGGGDSGPAQGDAAVWRRLMTASLVMLAVFEAVSIVGLVLFFLGAPLGVFLRYVVANLVLGGVGLAQLLSDMGRLGEPTGQAGP